jgi:hypothetical protein
MRRTIRGTLRFGAVVGVVAIAVGVLTQVAAAAAPDEVAPGFLQGKAVEYLSLAGKGGHESQKDASVGLPGVDSLPNFSVPFIAAGYDFLGNPRSQWSATFVGRPPSDHGTTKIDAPIVPVVIDLLNADGTQRFINGKPLIYAPFDDILPTLRSPVFADARWSSSRSPTQITDAIQRAEFASQTNPSWHTTLSPRLRQPRLMKLTPGSYLFALNANGTCCSFVLVDLAAFLSKLFPATVPVDNSTLIGAAELAGDMTTHDMSTFLFPNTFLYAGSPSNCCILGFHSYDFEPGDAANWNRERRYVMNYSSWISPGLFGPTFEDVTALSHEIAETYNDPFVDNATPWWLAPNGLCQNNLETGDVIEGLPNATFPITMNGMTYHPQNEALFQYFEFLTPSDALDGAYSYPDESVLTGPSAPQTAGCS